MMNAAKRERERERESKPRHAYRFNRGIIAICITALLVMSVFALVACNETDEVDKTIPVLTTRKIESSINALINQNYSCNLTTGNNSVSYKFNKDKVSVAENKSEYFYSIEENGIFKLEYNSSKVGYIKTTSSFDIDEVIYNSLKLATWKEYDKEKDIISGSIDGKDVTLKLKDNGSLDIEGESYKASIFDVDKTSVVLPSNIVDDAVEAEIPFEKINSAIKRLEAKNYTFNLVNDNVSSTYKVAGDSIAIEKNGSTKFFVKENDVAYDIVFDSNDNKWHKKFAEVDLDANDLIYNSLKSATWTVYDETTGVISGTINDKAVSIEILDNSIKVYGEDLNTEILNINSTTINLPDENEIIDETKPVELNEIYTIEDGKIVYNMVAITDVLTSWIKGDNAQNQDLISLQSVNGNFVLERIIYTNVLDNKLEFGILVNNENNIFYTIYEIDSETLINNIQSGDIKTKDDLHSKLKVMKLKYFRNSGLNKELEYTTLDNDFATNHKEQFDKLTSQVLAKLKETGVQVSYNNQNGQKEDLTEMEIIAGFKGKQTTSSSTGFDLGNYHAWNQYYLVKVGEKFQMLDFRIYSSRTYNVDVVGNVMKGMMGWMIGKLDKKDLDKGTGAIYQNDENQDTLPTSLSQQTYSPIAIRSKQ